MSRGDAPTLTRGSRGSRRAPSSTQTRREERRDDVRPVAGHAAGPAPAGHRHRDEDNARLARPLDRLRADLKQFYGLDRSDFNPSVRRYGVLPAVELTAIGERHDPTKRVSEKTGRANPHAATFESERSVEQDALAMVPDRYESILRAAIREKPPARTLH
jgi:hypothetical protein